ncbi:MAG: hypothetical protein ACMUIA_03590 [bacterium]
MQGRDIRRQVNVSCQGPLTRNNNALELAEHFIPRGGVLFTHLQGYDYLLSERDGTGTHSSVGRSRIFLLPFLKAFGATNQRIEEYSTVHILLMPGAKIFLDTIEQGMDCFVVSAAYEAFLMSFCHLVHFHKENAYCTPLNLDSYVINESERETLKDLADEITHLSPLSYKNGSGSLSEETQAGHHHGHDRLAMILGEEIPAMQIGELVSQHVVLAGHEKIKAVMDSLEKTGNHPEEVMYIGHSILDVAALNWIKTRGGLAVSCNGDQTARMAAEIAVTTGNSAILAILSEVFLQRGKEGVLEFVKDWDMKQVHTDRFLPYQSIINQFFSQEPESFPHLEIVTSHLTGNPLEKTAL